MRWPGSKHLQGQIMMRPKSSMSGIGTVALIWFFTRLKLVHQCSLPNAPRKYFSYEFTGNLIVCHLHH